MTIWSANEAHLKLFNGIADGYKRVKPDVTVSFDSLPFPTYTTALTTQIAGGNAPDMAWIFETTAQDFVNSGALFPLTRTLAATPGYNLAEVSAGATERWIEGRHAVRLSVLDLALRHVRQQRPDQEGRRKDTRGTDRRRPMDLGQRHRERRGGGEVRQGGPDRARLQLPGLAVPGLGLERLGRLALERRRQALHAGGQADGRCHVLPPRRDLRQEGHARPRPEPWTSLPATPP